jgi:anti-anti-sigma factor
VAVDLRPGAPAAPPEAPDRGRIQLVLHGACAELSLAGELDLASAGTLEEAVAHLDIAERDTVVVDLVDATFADSSFVAWLVDLSRRVDARSADLVVLVRAGPVRDLLELTGVGRMLTLVEDGGGSAAQRSPG